MSKDSELVVVLLGCNGLDKTSLIEAIQKSPEQSQDPSDTLIHVNKQSYSAVVGDHHMVFYKTPDLCNTQMKDEDVIKGIKACIQKDRRHIFLLMISLGPFEPQKEMVDTVKSVFGENVTDHTILLFTGENNKDEINLKDLINENKDVQDLDNKCGKRHVYFDTKGEDESQVKELLMKITGLKSQECYTFTMLRKAEVRVGQMRKLVLTMNSGVLVGAGVGATVSHFVPGALGIGAGVAVGAVTGGVVGAVGMVMVQHIKDKFFTR